jgi:hypothetical protein
MELTAFLGYHCERDVSKPSHRREAQEKRLTDVGTMYLRTFILAFVFALLVAGIGWLGDELNVGPGLVPIWDPDGRGYWVAALVLVGVAGLNYYLIDRPLEPRRADEPRNQSSPSAVSGALETNWIVPTMVVLSGVMILGVYRGTTAMIIASLVTFIGLILGPISRQMMMFAGEVGRERARVIFTLLVHGMAFLTLAMVYIHKVRSIFSATAVMIIGLLLFLALTEGEDDLFIRRLVYALVGGIMLGQVTWGLNYWQATGWTGGAVLLVCFYLFGGLILTHLRRGLWPRDVVEYGAVSIIALGIVVYSLLM